MITMDSLKLTNCSFCNKLIQTTILPSHEKQHKNFITGVIEEKQASKRQKLSCSYCGLKRMGKKSLDYHIKAFHASHDLKLLECDMCDKSFKFVQLLKYHKQTIHNTAKLIRCKVCNKEMKEHLLKSHRKSHVKVLHPCNQCDKKFANGQGLRQHALREHQIQNETFNCNVCTKKFMFKDYLSRHEKVHKRRDRFNF